MYQNVILDISIELDLLSSLTLRPESLSSKTLKLSIMGRLGCLGLYPTDILPIITPNSRGPGTLEISN